MDYWQNRQQRAEQAKAHTEQMNAGYAEDIKRSVISTTVYGYPDSLPGGSRFILPPEIILLESDSVSAAFQKGQGRTAVLNFASYKNPGGMFIEGSSAQEEALCHASFLYNVLAQFNDTYYTWNRAHLNRALYMNRALYTPHIRLFDQNPESNSFMDIDVITCAAPNFGAASKYQNISGEENHEALASRIHFIRMIAEEECVDTLILGAFGCGVFKQDPEETADLFQKEFTETSMGRIVFAVPPGKNFKPFQDRFGDKEA